MRYNRGSLSKLRFLATSTQSEKARNIFVILLGALINKLIINDEKILDVAFAID